MFIIVEGVDAVKRMRPFFMLFWGYIGSFIWEENSFYTFYTFYNINNEMFNHKNISLQASTIFYKMTVFYISSTK